MVVKARIVVSALTSPFNLADFLMSIGGGALRTIACMAGDLEGERRFLLMLISSLLVFVLYYLVLNFASFFGFTSVLTLSEVLELGVVVLIALVLIFIVLVCLPVFTISISKVVLLCVELVWLLL